MGPRDGLDGRKISSPPGFDPTVLRMIVKCTYKVSKNVWLLSLCYSGITLLRTSQQIKNTNSAKIRP